MTVCFLFISAAFHVVALTSFAVMGCVIVSQFFVPERSYKQFLYHVTTSKSGVTEDEVNIEVNIEGSNIIVALTNA